MITVHGRTVDSNKLWIGPAGKRLFIRFEHLASFLLSPKIIIIIMKIILFGCEDWEIIRKIKQSVSIPVIANGGVSCRADALRCLSETGADGVMSSEALLENPRLFCEKGDHFFRTDYVKAQFATVREYLDITLAHKLPRPLFQVVRSHLFKMLYRFMDSPAHLDLRQQLATGDLEQMMDVVAQLEIRLATVGFSTEEAEAGGLINGNTWYMRHRNEKSAKRILSPKRSTKGFFQDAITTPSSSSASDRPNLDLLKARLLERKKKGEPALSSSFAQFIARTDDGCIR
jgi:hypothetical protein